MKNLFTFILCFACLTGCSKKDAEPENYLSLKIDGKSWSGNVVNSENENVSATVAQNLLIVAAERDADNARTSVAVIFPENIVTDQEVEFNSDQKTIMAYGANNVDAYLLDVKSGGSGKLIVSRYDKENSIVEGTFSGTAIHSKNGSKLKIEDGKFRSKIYLGTVTTTPGKK